MKYFLLGLRLALALGYVPLCLLTALGLVGGDLGWPDLMSHLLWQQALGLLVSIALWAWLRPRWAMVPGLCLLVLAGLRLAPLYGPAPTPPEPGWSLRVISCNVLQTSRAYGTVSAYLLARDADLIVLTEVTPTWENALQEVQAAYPYRHVAAQWGYFGMMVLSRYPLREAETHYLVPARVPTIRAVIETPAGPLGLLAVHPTSPPDRREMRWRNEILAGLAGLRATLPPHTLLAGDLNATGFSPVFRRLCRATGLYDSRRGYGRQPSWPARLGPLGIDLDHLLLSPELAVSQRRIGPDLGSDHLPLEATVVLPAAQP